MLTSFCGPTGASERYAPAAAGAVARPVVAEVVLMVMLTMLAAQVVPTTVWPASASASSWPAPLRPLLHHRCHSSSALYIYLFTYLFICIKK